MEVFHSTYLMSLVRGNVQGFGVCPSSVLPHPGPHCCCDPVPVQMETKSSTLQSLLFPYTEFPSSEKQDAGRGENCTSEPYPHMQLQCGQDTFWELMSLVPQF